MSYSIIVNPEDPIHMEIKRLEKFDSEMIHENISSTKEKIVEYSDSSSEEKITYMSDSKEIDVDFEFSPPDYPRPSDKNSLEDIEWLVQFCNNVAPDDASVSISMCGNYLTVSYPKLSKKQLKFLVNRIILREKLGLGDWIWFFCRENIRNSKKSVFYCCRDNILTETIDNKTVSFEVSNFLETIVDAWLHLQVNENDLWLNGTGEPLPEEDHTLYWKDMMAKKELLKK